MIPVLSVIPNSVLRRTTFALDSDQLLSELNPWGAAVNAMAAALGVDAAGVLGAGVADWLLTPSSANLLAALSTKTGTGVAVFSDSPTLTTPALGTPSAIVLTNASGTAASLTAGLATAANGLKSSTTTVSVSAATAPSAGQVLTASSSTAASWVTPTVSLNTIAAATGNATLANAARAIAWNWALTGASNVGFTFGETTASTAGVGAQDLVQIATAAGSTANPLRVNCRGTDVILVGRNGDMVFTTLDGVVGNVNGRAISLTGGAYYPGDTTSDGGAVSMTGGQGGSAGTGVGGAATLQAGSGGAGGAANVLGGASAVNAAAGAVNLVAGSASGASGGGGAVNITSGSGLNSSSSGDIVLTIGSVVGGTNGKINFVNANVANGAVATAMSSVGPTGAATTIQGWLAIKVGGTARFVPFW